MYIADLKRNIITAVFNASVLYISLFDISQKLKLDSAPRVHSIEMPSNLSVQKLALVPPPPPLSPVSRCRALDCLLEPGKRVVEVGSGLGYWAHLLKMRCGDDNRVRCFDPYASTPYPKTREVGIGPQDPEGSDESEGVIEADDDDSDVWFGEGRSPFVPVERGSSERIAGDPNGFRDWSLFICWPSDGRWPRDCIHAFQGDDFFYVGEEEGGATRMPWRVLREEWQLERKVDIPRWPGFKDALWWYRRRGAAPLPPNR